MSFSPRQHFVPAYPVAQDVSSCSRIQRPPSTRHSRDSVNTPFVRFQRRIANQTALYALGVGIVGSSMLVGVTVGIGIAGVARLDPLDPRVRLEASRSNTDDLVAARVSLSVPVSQLEEVIQSALSASSVEQLVKNHCRDVWSARGLGVVVGDVKVLGDNDTLKIHAPNLTGGARRWLGFKRVKVRGARLTTRTAMAGILEYFAQRTATVNVESARILWGWLPFFKGPSQSEVDSRVESIVRKLDTCISDAYIDKAVAGYQFGAPCVIKWQ